MSRAVLTLGLGLLLVALFASGWVHPPGAREEPVQSASTNASPATPPASSNASGGWMPLAPPAPPANATPTPAPAVNATQNATAANDTSAANATAPAPPPPPPPAPRPAFREENQTVAWNATLEGGGQCVSTFGMPVCVPDGSPPASHAKALGGSNVTRGKLTFSWGDQSGPTPILAQLVAGKNCTGDVCASTRDLNLTASGSSSPLVLNVGRVTLAQNETLLLVLSLDCGGGDLGGTDCSGSSVAVTVAGWLDRLVPNDA